MRHEIVCAGEILSRRKCYRGRNGKRPSQYWRSRVRRLTWVTIVATRPAKAPEEKLMRIGDELLGNQSDKALRM
jgi:hypothetical protein